MTPALPHRIFRSRCLGLTALLITLAIGLGARAAISEGPKPINEYEAQKRRNVELFEANQSYQEQLRVGQERYRQMQTNRAKIIASMAAEFQARQQVVVLQPAAAPPAIRMRRVRFPCCPVILSIVASRTVCIPL